MYVNAREASTALTPRLANVSPLDSGYYGARGRALSTATPRAASPRSGRSGLTPDPRAAPWAVGVWGSAPGSAHPDLLRLPPRGSTAASVSRRPRVASIPDEVVVWSGRIARIRRPFHPGEGSAAPDFEMARSPRAVQTASRLGLRRTTAAAAAAAAAVERLELSARPSITEQRAADQARHLQRGSGASVWPLGDGPRVGATAALDAPWLAPEQRDLLTYVHERMRETRDLVQLNAAHTGQVSASAAQKRPWHDPSLGLQMALPKLQVRRPTRSAPSPHPPTHPPTHSPTDEHVTAHTHRRSRPP